MRCQIKRIVALGAFGVALAGCVQTSRVDEAVTTGKLASSNKAVAVMRLGSASPACINVRVLLGTRQGEGYVRNQVVTVANVRSLTQSQVAEVELDPGEYHVIGYACMAEKGNTTITDPAGGQLYGTSFAHFMLGAGEIVNVGYFHFGASKDGHSVFGRGIRTDVEVSDWPLAEIERFKQARPTVYAQMKTRLMVLGDTLSAQESQRTCERWAALKADGKVQDVPPGCGGAVPQTKRTQPKV